MALVKVKPTSAGRRGLVKVVNDKLHKGKPFAGLLADNVPVLIAYVDRDERYRFTNRAYQAALMVAPQQTDGRRVSEVLDAARGHEDQALHFVRVGQRIERRHSGVGQGGHGHKGLNHGFGKRMRPFFKKMKRLWGEKLPDGRGRLRRRKP